jgi:hypothetical protein
MISITYAGKIKVFPAFFYRSKFIRMNLEQPYLLNLSTETNIPDGKKEKKP